MAGFLVVFFGAKWSMVAQFAGKASLQKKPAVCKLAGGRTWRADKGLCRREARVCRKRCMAGLT